MSEDTDHLARMMDDVFPKEAEQRRNDQAARAEAENHLKQEIQRLERQRIERVPDDFHWYAEGTTEDPEQAEIFRQQGYRIQQSDELRALRKRLAELQPAPIPSPDKGG